MISCCAELIDLASDASTSYFTRWEGPKMESKRDRGAGASNLGKRRRKRRASGPKEPVVVTCTNGPQISIIEVFCEEADRWRSINWPWSEYPSHLVCVDAVIWCDVVELMVWVLCWQLLRDAVRALYFRRVGWGGWSLPGQDGCNS